MVHVNLHLTMKGLPIFSASDSKKNSWSYPGISDARDGTTGGTADQVPGFQDTLL